MIYGFINTIVHAIMYTYYFIAAYDSKMQWLHRWKKFITQVQLVSSRNEFSHQFRWIDVRWHCKNLLSYIYSQRNDKFVPLRWIGNFDPSWQHQGCTL